MSEEQFLGAGLRRLKQHPRCMPWPPPTSNNDASLLQASSILETIHTEYYASKSRDRNVAHVVRCIVPRFAAYPPW